MKKIVTICPTCGLKKVVYKTHLSRVVIDLAVKLHERGQPARASELCPGLSERTNSYKNQFWGFITPYVTPELKARRGWWQLTEKGKDFVAGKIYVKKTALTLNSEVLGFEGELVSIKDLIPEYQLVGDWKDQARQQIIEGCDGDS